MMRRGKHAVRAHLPEAEQSPAPRLVLRGLPDASENLQDKLAAHRSRHAMPLYCLRIPLEDSLVKSEKGTFCLELSGTAPPMEGLLRDPSAFVEEPFG